MNKFITRFWVVLSFLLVAVINAKGIVLTVTSVSPASGPSSGGTPVVITGSSFETGATVSFGAVTVPAASVTVVSSTQIMLASPPNTGLVDVTVSVGGRTSPISAADQFAYTAVPFDLYVANFFSNTVSKVTGAGRVSTFTTIPNVSANVTALAFDSSRDLYVTAFYSNTISEITPDGDISTFVDSTDNDFTPAALAFDASGTLYVADYYEDTILKVTPDGTVSTFVGDANGLRAPAALAFDANGNLYVANSATNTISEITPAGVVSTFVQNNSLVYSPTGLAFDGSGNLYVANYYSNSVSKVTPGGVVSAFLSPADGVLGPIGLAFDGAGNLYINSVDLNSVLKVTPAGVVSTFATGFDFPWGLALEPPADAGVVSINGSTTKPTNLASVSWTVRFNDSIINLSAANFALVNTGLGGTPAITAVTPVGGPLSDTWTVTASAGTGVGTLGLVLNNSIGVTPTITNLPATSLVYNIDTVPPAVTITGPTTPSANATNQETYTVIFSDPNLAAQQLTAGNISLDTTGSANARSVIISANLSLYSTNAIYDVTLSNFVGNGTIGITVPANAEMDAAGNASTNSGPSAAFALSAIAPQVIISGPSLSLDTNNSPVDYTITYRSTNLQAVTLAPGNITLNETGTATGSVYLLPTASKAVWQVAISNVSGTGTLSISVAPGTAIDTAGNLAPAAGPSASVALFPAGSTNVTQFTSIANGPGANSVTVSLAGIPGATYQIRATTNVFDLANMASSGWQTVGTLNLNPINGTGTLSVLGGAAAPLQIFSAKLQLAP